MQKREVAITNRLGLHARASAKMVRLASQFRSSLTLEYAGRRADARNIVAIMLLAATVGGTIVVEADGPDEAAAMKAMVTLMEGRFGERQ
ncbi:MAG TPA: HPr family phosphocarrier protein [Casimicrobiaceae bacterium]